MSIVLDFGCKINRWNHSFQAQLGKIKVDKNVKPLK